MAHHHARGEVDDEGEAFARAVFCRFLRQATICQDIDDIIEHMHIVNDDSRTFDIRLGGDTRIPVSRELIFALAAKKKELLGLCESTLRTSSRGRGNSSGGDAASTASSVHNGGSGNGNDAGSSLHRQPHPPSPAVVYPPPTALAAMQSVGGSMAVTVGSVPVGSGSGSGSGGGGLAGAGAAASPVVVVRQEEAVPVAAGAGAAAAARVTGREEQAPMVVVAQHPQPLPDHARPAPVANPPAAFVPANRPPAALARAGAGDTSGPKTIFVRKVDLKVVKEDLIEHFSSFGEVVAISMNPSRGYAFVDYPSHDCVVRAVSATEHTVGHRTLVVEEKKEPPKPALPRYGQR